MQNKGLIKFFTVVFAIVCIYQLSFTWVANSINEKAKLFAKGNTNKELAYLDSLKNEKVYGPFTLDDVRNQQINKGLDLEGGINVMLQISVKDIIKGLANNSKNPTFNRALDNTKAIQQGNQDYIEAFFESFEKESNGSLKLASAEVFYNNSLQDVVKLGMTDDQVKVEIRKKVDEIVDSAFKVIRERIDKFGVVQPNIQKLGTSGRILVELPGAKDIDRIEKLLVGTAQLEFWETYKADEVINYLANVDKTLKSSLKTAKVVTKDSTTAKKEVKNDKDKVAELLEKKEEKDKKEKPKKGENPLFELLSPYQQGSVIGVAQVKDTAKINSYFKRPEIQNLAGGNLANVKLVWSKSTVEKPTEEQLKKDKNAKDIELIQLYALKGNSDNIAPLTGSVITDASNTYDSFGKPAVSMQMNGIGSTKWEELTGLVSKQQNAIAIVLDNIVYSAPGVSKGPISGGRSEISGNFTIDETKDLANVLKAGKLPASAEIVQKEIVGPTLGQEAIDNGITSSIVGLLLVSLWMVFYYGRAGWYANVALLVNLLFIFGAMASFPGGFVLTLPGIAGIVLTMGTAVDANIIIYERAKEELRHGLSLEEAVKIAFGWKGAMRSIIDANVTHILTGIILYIFGSGPIKGFATTLLIGIFTSLFTSIFIARLFIDADIRKGRSLKFCTETTKNWFTNFNFDFLKVKKFTYIFSLTVCVVSFISFFTNGFDQGIDFVGGRTFQVKFDKEVVAEDVAKALSAENVFGSAEAKTFGTKDQLKITTKYKINEEGSTIDSEVNKKLYEALKPFYNKALAYEEFTNATEGKTQGVMQAMKVGPTVAKDIKTNAYWAVIGAMLVVCAYLVISFRRYQYSLGAIAAVAHDVIFVLGIYSLLHKFMPFHMEIDQHFIAAILTVIGYSMNDTVIVFDRIREFLGGQSRGNFNKIVNDSINTTLSRTLNTSLSMILVLLIMFIFGGDSIRGFIFAMLVGIIVGTYSSLFIATPVLVDSISSKTKHEIEDSHK